MAIFGPLSTVRAQLAVDPRFTAAFAYAAEVLLPASAARRRMEQVAVGASEKIELTGGAFAIEAAYFSKARPEGFFESHRKYIDVQLVIAGAELMEVEDVARLTLSEAYNPDRDFIKYADTATASLLKVYAGDTAIFGDMQLGPSP